MAFPKIVAQHHSGGGRASFIIDIVQEAILQILKDFLFKECQFVLISNKHIGRMYCMKGRGDEWL